MKRNIVVLCFVSTALLLALSGLSSADRIKTDGNSAPSDVQKSSKPEKERYVFGIDGKRFGRDEKYVAERTLSNGRTIGYRKNKREIAALVKALKEDGITDKKLLDPNTWIMIICQKSLSSGCQGGCGIGYTCKASSHGIERTSKPSIKIEGLDYCVCIH